MVSVRIEASGVKELQAMLMRAIEVAPAEARKVVAKGALNIKKGMQARTAGLAHAPSLPSSITYDTKESAFGAEAEIGPDKSRRQGALGNLVNYGSVNNGPRPFVEPAADEETPRFERAMEDLAMKALEGL